MAIHSQMELCVLTLPLSLLVAFSVSRAWTKGFLGTTGFSTKDSYVTYDRWTGQEPDLPQIERILLGGDAAWKDKLRIWIPT